MGHDDWRDRDRGGDRGRGSREQRDGGRGREREREGRDDDRRDREREERGGDRDRRDERGDRNEDFDEKRVVDLIVGLVTQNVGRLLEDMQSRAEADARANDRGPSEREIVDMVVRKLSANVREIVAEELDKRLIHHDHRDERSERRDERSERRDEGGDRRPPPPGPPPPPPGPPRD